MAYLFSTSRGNLIRLFFDFQTLRLGNGHKKTPPPGGAFERYCYERKKYRKNRVLRKEQGFKIGKGLWFMVFNLSFS